MRRYGRRAGPSPSGSWQGSTRRCAAWSSYTATATGLKEERSGLDFEDLQVRARDLLRDNEPIRIAYQQRFAEVMVDEFQDTNELQLQLIDLLVGRTSAVRRRR